MDHVDRQALFDAQVRAKIALHGWAVQGVGAGPGELQFCYTVGLAAHGLPEFIVFGLRFETATPILNDLGQRAVAGEVFAAGEVRTDVLHGGYEATFIEVLDTREHLTVANRFYGLPFPVRALQVIFTDASHRWPWDRDSGVSEMPLLGPRQA